MRKLLLASTALVAFAAAGAANAADLPLKAPPVAAPSDCHCEWTGWYLGVNAGGSIGVDDNVSAFSGFPLAPGFTNPFLSSTDKRAMPGGLFGVQGGFNWHMGNTVVGVEADWQWTNESTTMSVTGADQFPAVATFSYTAQEKIKSLATARARLGWAHNDYLWYVTGGAAWASIDSNFTLTSSFPPTTFASPFNASFNTTRTGWTIGGGVETCFLNYGPHNYWSAKLEYLFVDLGTINTLLTTPTTTAGTFATFAASDRFRDHIMRVGLNYHF